MLGVVFLSIATALTGLGLTWLAPRLQGVAYLTYWLVPILAALGAIGCAMIDMRIMRRRYREDRENLARDVFQRSGSSRNQ